MLRRVSVLRALSSTPNAASTTARGTAYEVLAVEWLRGLGIHARRSGGPHDEGIDLIGDWMTAASGAEESRQRVPIVGQCKHEAQPLGTGAIRSFEASMRRVETPGSVGFLFASAGFSKFALQHVAASDWPIVALDLRETPTGTEVQTCVCGPIVQRVLPFSLFQQLTSRSIRRPATER